MNKVYTQKMIIAVLAVLLAATASILAWRMFFSKPISQTMSNSADVTPSTQPDTSTYTNTPNKPVPHDIITEKTIDFLPYGTGVNPSDLEKSFGISIPGEKNDPNNGPYGTVDFYKVGTFMAKEHKGQDLYQINSGCNIPFPNCINALAVFDQKTKKFEAFARYSTQSGLVRVPFTPKNNAIDMSIKKTLDYPLDGLSYFTAESIPDLEAPDELAIGNGYSLTRASFANGTVNDVGPDPIGETANGTYVYYSGNYYLRLPSGEHVQYDLNIPYDLTNRIPDVTWNSNGKTSFDYTPMITGGCGALSYNVIASNFDVVKDRFVPAGKTSTGEAIYEPKNNDPLVVTDYSIYVYGVGSGSKLSLAQYIAMHPLFITKTPFNQAIVWQRSDLFPMSECGKPVVYLYPTQTEKVAVKLGSNITVTKSEPTYAKGWNVIAEPNGTLATAGGQTFPYLYWDGNGATYPEQTTGFVVARKDVEATFKSKLAQLGLNAKEISDFNDFWLPIVSKSPFALISFVPQAEWSKAAPLSISPAPDTVIRVFMDWKPLSVPIDVAPETLPPTPQRTGFTAVEWGGILYQ
jgi:hypothetical protein